MIIAIDGPAGAGKSTVAKTIAAKLGFLYIDTGAMYRALTLKAIQNKIQAGDTARIIEMAAGTRIELCKKTDGSLRVLLDGADVSLQIRQPQVTRLVSDISRIKQVRQFMLKLQRELGESGDAVLDGRDIGTVVFPRAERKFYIDAKFGERVERRYKELFLTDSKITLSEVEADLSNRDRIDSTRECAPLKKAEDAIYIDTTDMSIEKVVATVLKYIPTQDPKRKA